MSGGAQEAENAGMKRGRTSRSAPSTRPEYVVLDETPTSARPGEGVRCRSAARGGGGGREEGEDMWMFTGEGEIGEALEAVGIRKPIPAPGGPAAGTTISRELAGASGSQDPVLPAPA